MHISCSCQLDFVQFERVFRNQIQLFVQRQMSNTLTIGMGGDFEVYLHFFSLEMPIFDIQESRIVEL